MKNLLALLILVATSCATPAAIVTASYSLQLPSGAGVSSTITFTDFSSSVEGGKTKLTFSNADGDMLNFLVGGIKVGKFPIDANPIAGSFTILDENGTLSAVQVQSNGVGTLTITSLTGSKSSVTSIFGNFESNIQVSGDTESGSSPSGSGTIRGNIGYNATSK